MKAITLILALTTGFLIAISVAQWHKSSNLREQVASLTRENEEKAKEVENLQAARTHAERERNQLLRSSAELAEQVRTQQLAANLAPTNAVAPPPLATNTGSEKPDKAGLGNFLSKMMQDPDTKKFIRDQQRAMMDQMYGPLVKKLGLSAEEAASFKDLMADHAIKAAEKATSIFGASPGVRAELAGSIAAEQKDFEEQVKAFLGEDRYGVYKEYQETVADRTQLTMFKQQFSSSDYPINDIQTEQLLALIKDERRNVAATTGQQALPGSGRDLQNFEAMLSPEQSEKLLQSQDLVNQRVYERARTVLSPDQLNSFGAFQSNQLQTMRLGISMARKMMTPDKAEGGVPGQNP